MYTLDLELFRNAARDPLLPRNTKVVGKSEPEKAFSQQIQSGEL